MTRGKGPKPKKGPSSSSPKTPSGKPSQNSHYEAEDLLEMSPTETEHGNKDLEAFADRLIKNYDSKVSKLLDEKLHKLNEQFSTRFGKIEKAKLNISEKCTKLNKEMTAVSHKADTNEDSTENLREELESRDKKIDTLEREIDDLRWYSEAYLKKLKVLTLGRMFGSSYWNFLSCMILNLHTCQLTEHIVLHERLIHASRRAQDQGLYLLNLFPGKMQAEC